MAASQAKSFSAGREAAALSAVPAAQRCSPARWRRRRARREPATAALRPMPGLVQNRLLLGKKGSEAQNLWQELERK